MQFAGDAFISYAHLDNVELVEGRKGWVANLHRALEVRVAQLLGKPPQIWRDPKLSGNDLFEASILDRLRRVAILVAVVSPRYLKSEWTIRELEEFRVAAEAQGGLRVQDKARIFKVLKTPVPLDRLPDSLRGLLGYEFFRLDPESGKIRELDEIFGSEAHRDFWLQLDDLAHDVCALLEMLEREDANRAAASSAALTGGAPARAASQAAARPAAAPGPAATTNAVFLAETTSDLREYREAVRRDLQQSGLVVLPDRPLPFVAAEAEALARDQLAMCRLSIHLIGRHYGVVPEGSDRSLIELQHELATERSQSAPLARLIWIPEGLSVDDDRQRRVLDRLRMDPRVGTEADLLETYFEDLRTTIQDWLRRPAPAPPAAADATTPVERADADDEPPRLYLVADERDVARLDPWADALFDQGLEVLRPVYEGDEREIREYHEENLATCDGVLIFYGSGSEAWVRRKLRDVQKAPGYGRTKPRPAVGICLVGPRTPEKERFRTHEATVIPQWDGVGADGLRPLVEALKKPRC
ncbi:MAG: DUF4062 domain-containing protein [Vicinamibacterales bacterium]